MDPRAKKRFSDFAYKTRDSSNGAPKIQNFDEKIKYPREIICHHF